MEEVTENTGFIRTHLPEITVGGLATLIVMVGIGGYRLRPVLEAPQVAANAGQEAKMARQRADSALKLIKQGFRSLRTVFCTDGSDGPTITQQERVVLRCGRLDVSSAYRPRIPVPVSSESVDDQSRGGFGFTPPAYARQSPRETSEMSRQEALEWLASFARDGTGG